MTALREALDRLAAFAQTLPARAPHLPLPEELPSTRMLRQIVVAGQAPAQRPPAELEALRQRLLAAPSEASRRDLRMAPWIFWQGKPRLGENLDLVRRVFVQALTDRLTLRTLIEAWVKDFDTADRGLAGCGRAIVELLRRPGMTRFETWQRAQKRLRFFEADQGPPQLARWLLDGPEEVPLILADVAFDDPLRAVSGYAKAVQREMVGFLGRKDLATPNGTTFLQRGRSYLETETGLRFPDLAGEMARGLLEPQGRIFPEAIRQGLSQFLLRHLGDPRINRGRWLGTGTAATALMCGWLSAISLEAFFDLIGEFALDHQWRYRKAFWNACRKACEQQGIEFGAWLILGTKVHASARAVLALGDAYAPLAGTSANQSVLLMKIGPLVLAEWSHAGRLHAWPQEWKTAPELYRTRRYAREDLARSGLPFPPNPVTSSRGTDRTDGLSHFHPETNYWQGSAAELLRRRTGLRLNPWEWRPR